MFHLADLAAWMGRNLVGGSHVIVPSFTPDGALSAIEQHRPTDALLVPTMIQLLVDYPGVADRDLDSLQQVRLWRKPDLGGTPRPSHAGAARRAADPGLRHDRAGADRHHAGPRGAPRPRAAPVGRPGRARTRWSRSSTTDGVEVPRGEVGEIVIHGDHVMQGYWGKPEETAAALVDGWMHSGDGGRMDDDGYVFVVDRIKDMIVSGGENVYSAEVENAITTHAGSRRVRRHRRARRPSGASACMPSSCCTRVSR